MATSRLQTQGELRLGLRAGVEGSAHQTRPYRGMLATMAGIVREEGAVRLYRGLPPAVLRHMVYSGVRIPLFELLRSHVVEPAVGGEQRGATPSVWKVALCAGTAGAVGQLLSSPTDLLKVQAQMEGLRTLQGKPPRFAGVWQTAVAIFRERGIAGLWRGAGPNCARAALVNMGDLTTYSTLKHILVRDTSLGDNTITHALSSVAASFTACILGTPPTTLRTRMMNDPTTYKSALDCLLKTVRTEGPLGLYKGFLPIYVRMLPWSMTYWLVYERVRSLAGVQSF